MKCTVMKGGRMVFALWMCACAPRAPRSPEPAGPVMASPAEVGVHPSVLARVDSIITTAIADGAAPGAAVAIGRHGKLIKLQGYGRLDNRTGYAAVSESSIFDLASLTKVVGTTSAAMMLVDEGRLELDAPLARYLPEWRHYLDKQQITVRNLLQHNAGFRAFAPFYRTYSGRQQYFEAIALLPLEYPTGEKTIYSDFSVILLALAIERVTDTPLDEFLRQRLFEPLGMHDTGYNPSEKLRDRIAPTEIDTIFRHRHIHGDVHDENAFALGGVAGHAGLFSSARDLAKFAQMLLNGGEYAGRRFINAHTVAQFTRRQSENSSRALGWDTPGPNSSAGDYFSATSFGHTGFTGTSIWMDPENDLFVILLTNRVNPSRDNQKIGPLRRALADAVQQAVLDVPSVKRDWTLP